MSSLEESAGVACSGRPPAGQRSKASESLGTAPESPAAGGNAEGADTAHGMAGDERRRQGLLGGLTGGRAAEAADQLIGQPTEAEAGQSGKGQAEPGDDMGRAAARQW